MALLQDEAIKDEFDIFGIELTHEIIDKLKELCVTYSLDAERVAAEWIAFSNVRKNLTISLENLDVFDREKLAKKMQRTPQTPLTKKTQQRVYNIDNVSEGVNIHDAENLYNTYGGTPSSKGTAAQKRQLTPENPTIKRFQSNMRSPVVPFSPASFSPVGATPSKKYRLRTNAGDVVASFGNLDNIKWQSRGQNCTIKWYDPLNNLLKEEKESLKDLSKNFKYMFQKLTAKASVLNEMIDDMAQQLQEKNNIEEFSHVSLPVQEEVTLVGRICCDSLGKLNAKSVILEGSRDTSAGCFIHLDLSDLKQYSLFPGQVVALDGINTSGQKFVVKKLYEGVVQPLPACSDEKDQIDCSEMTVLIAAGPFSTSDNLAFEPLADLVKLMWRDTPDVVILMGPFVDVKNDLIESGTCTNSFEEIFKAKLAEISSEASSAGCQVIVLPSYRDVHHDYVYPQPPFFHHNSRSETLKEFPNLHFMPDPCVVDINNVLFGITSSDIMFQLGAEEISFNPPGASDRMARLAEHLLTQQSFYPLYPSPEDINVDYEVFDHYAHMPTTPHVLILPSDLKQFIKEIQGCCCINPGRLSRGQAGGTFSRLHIQAGVIISQQSILPSITAQVLKI
ncbi:DNA polymerase alpha subunit B-like [Saccostrea echinata]|uniref:DNA polymerase alpha subunit B-like n=1 Tax=Saccostrea echinata TaxID=191078 RepID=UPI002A834BEF|nr:DNA polymerase alpha subunit B-like [Saccostrea echinata]